MFGLSFSELALAAIVAFILFGPEQFPSMVRQIVTWVQQLKKFATEAQTSLRDATESLEKDLNLPELSTLNTSFNPKEWTQSPQQNQVSHDTQVSLEKIQLDLKPEHYKKSKVDWKQLIDIDRNPDHYKEEALPQEELRTS